MSIYDKSSLVLIPSGTKAGKVYSQKPVSGDGDFTFTRSSAATRVNADGNIEKETSNLLTYSNTFSSWTPANAVLTDGQSGYDGTSDAWLLDKAASAGNIQLNVSSSGVNTFSYYAKAGSVDWTRLLILGTTNASTYINLTNGAIGVGGGGFIDATATDVGSGWWRVSITHSTAITQVRIYPAPADNDTSGSSGNIYIQDAQLEQGLVARDVITTTTSAVYGGITDNVPRLDYTDSSCPSFLLEPQRSNLVTFSEYYNASDWAKSGSPSVTTNSAVSPSGLQNASTLTSTASSDRIQLTRSAITGSATYSAYVKSNGAYTKFRLRDSGSGNDARFDVEADGTITYDTGTNTSYKIEEHGNGWYRLSFTFTAATGTSLIQLFPDFTSGGGSAYVWGVQMESGSHATSYIPCYGSSVTRVGEFSTQVENFTDLPTSYPFAIYSEPYLTNAIGNGAWAFYENSHQYSYYSLRITSQGKFNMLSRPQGVTQNEVNSTSTYSEGFHKVLCVYESETTIKIYVNGALEGTNSNCTNNSFKSDANDFLLGMFRGIDIQPCSIRQFMLFNNSLTDQEAIDLTTI